MSKKFLFLAIFSISLLQASNALALAPVPECQAGCSYKLNAIGISRSQNNVLDFPLELDSANTSNINTLLGADGNYPNALAIKPGEKLAISWNVLNEPTNANYSVSYGCSNTISGIKETTKIIDTNEYPIFWTTPNNGNCYCRLWIRMKNGSKVLAGAMSRPFDICGTNKTIAPFSNFEPTSKITEPNREGVTTSLMVYGESATYDEQKNSLLMKISIWPNVPVKKDLEWWMNVYMKDKDGNISNQQEWPVPRGKITIDYPKGNHSVSTTIANLPKLPNKDSAWCFQSFARHLDGSTQWNDGQEVCSPAIPWVKTLSPNPNIINSDHMLPRMGGRVTFFANVNKVNVWFEYGSLSQDIKKTQEKTITKGSSTSFWEAVKIMKPSPFYRACVRLEGSSLSSCGDWFFPMERDPELKVEVETEDFVTSGNATIYRGKATGEVGFIQDAICHFRLFPKNSTNEASYTKIDASLPNTDTQIFFKQNSVLNFKNSKYCYRAYCEVKGTLFKAENRICADGGQ